MAGAPLGEIIYSAVKPMIRMYMIIGTGFFLTRKGLFGVTTARACSDMVLMLFMPALVFDKVVSYISISDIKTIGVICFSAFIMYCINSCIALLIVKFTPIPRSPEHRWVGGALLAGIMQNVSDLPIAFIQAVSIFSVDQQNKGTAYVIIWLAMYVLAQFNCGLFQLVEWDFKYADSKTSDSKNTINKDIEKNSIHNENDLDTDTTSIAMNHKEQLESQQSHHDHESVTQPKAYTAATNTLHSYTSESPISPVSSISNSELNHMAQSNALNPKPLTKISSRLSQLSRSASRLSQISRTASRLSQISRTVSRANAIARIPSARSNFTTFIGENNNDTETDIDDEDDRDDDDESNTDNVDDVMSLNQELIREYSHVEPFNKKMSKTMKIITETNLSMKDVQDAGKEISFIKKYHLHYLIFFLQNFKKPNSISICVSITLALIPWTKALFVNTGTVEIANAPDKEPALSFVLMYAEYLGYPCVPIGLLIIGSVLARLEFGDIPKGFWKSAVCHTVFRLGILPIIGAALITKFRDIGWLSDPMAIFACSMEFALPSATVQIYLTAGAMRPGDKTCTPLNCFGLYLALQYAVLVISMPIVVSFCLKNTMHM
ncbi:hypothetical protein C6P40_000087 [Pichia californica]|uniref:Auxin efflux carrier n=1 Tax=Pichia californica TaxID=460514 RepID=A0A9P7BHV6_9ASCO|nr:hypothetical protein C6P42_000955 [[Candida] californica]KAG0691040.1 hypothetical protein C6P40_000087 [[Candida] californica]